MVGELYIVLGIGRARTVLSRWKAIEPACFASQLLYWLPLF